MSTHAYQTSFVTKREKIQATVISPLEDIQITPIKVSQTGENEQFCQAKGFRIIAGSEKFDLFVMREDIVKGINY